MPVARRVLPPRDGPRTWLRRCAYGRSDRGAFLYAMRMAGCLTLSVKSPMPWNSHGAAVAIGLDDPVAPANWRRYASTTLAGELDSAIAYVGPRACSEPNLALAWQRERVGTRCSLGEHAEAITRLERAIQLSPPRFASPTISTPAWAGRISLLVITTKLHP